MKLDITESKNISFEVSIQGIDHTLLEGALRLKINEIEYGFPIKINSNSIEAEIPVLSEIVKNIENGSDCEAKLEIYGEGFYLKPWNETLTLQSPVKVKAVIKEDDQLIQPSEPKIQITSKPIIKKEVNKTDVIVEKKKPKTKKEIIEEKILEQFKLCKTKEEKQKFINKLKRNQKVSESKIQTNKKNNKIQIESINDVIEFMSNNGMKNRLTQTRMLENAKLISNSEDPEDLYEVIKKMLNK